MTAILEAALDAPAELDGKKVTSKHLMASLAVQVVTTGKAQFPSGEVLQVSPKDWLDTVKWVYAQVDGPPKNEEELEGRVDAEINGFLDKISSRLGESVAAQVLAACFGSTESHGGSGPAADDPAK